MLLLLACTAAPVLPSGGDDTAATGFDRLPDAIEDLGNAPGADTDTTDPTDDTGEGSDTAEDAQAQAEYDLFFDPTVLQELRLTIADDAIRALNRDPFTWQHASLEINGTAFADIAVRIKGSSTLRDFNTKPSLKFKLNEFTAGQKYGDMERITINNMVEDGAQSREFLDYRVFNEAGLIASHTSFAHLYVNDEDYGLYTAIEAMDDHWVSRRYEQDGGDLWEANDGADFSRWGLDSWAIASGAGDQAALEAVITALNDRDGTLYDNLDTVLDMDQYLAFWAWSIVVGNSDGYPYTSNDVFMYGDPADGGRFDFAPWGMDEAWSSMRWNSASCLLGSRCLADADCEQRLRTAITTALDTYATFDVTGWAEAGYALTADVVAADTHSPYSPTQVTRARGALEETLGTWPEELRGDLE